MLLLKSNKDFRCANADRMGGHFCCKVATDQVDYICFREISKGHFYEISFEIEKDYK